MPISPSLAATRFRNDAGWAFAAPFRPFFLGAALHAALAVPVWIWMHLSGIPEVSGMPALSWHAHEMVFGYLPAVMAGYLLSATPNWTGRLPASGWPLAGLFCIWLAGRVVPLAASQPIAILSDAAFPLAMAWVLGREASANARGQSRHGLVLFPLLALAAVTHRLWAGDYELASMLGRLGIAVGVLMIAAVGGRLVPSLTRNALAGRGAGAERVPEPYGRFDVAVLVASSVGLVAWVAAPAHPASGAFLAIGGALNLVRLARWRGWLLWSPGLSRTGGMMALHAGYLWLVAGMTLAALAAAPLRLVSPDAALHAFSAGAIGTMTMAVMVRLSATRGAGARARPRLALAAIALVSLGALLRSAAPLLGDVYLELLVAGATCWSLAFALFMLAQLPLPQICSASKT